MDNARTLVRAVAIIYLVVWLAGMGIPAMRQLPLAQHVVVGGLFEASLLWNGFWPWPERLPRRTHERILFVVVLLAHVHIGVVVALAPRFGISAMVALTLVASVSALVLAPLPHAVLSAAAFPAIGLVAAAAGVEPSLLLWTLLTGAGMALAGGFTAARMARDIAARERATRRAERASATLRTLVETLTATTRQEAGQVMRATVAAAPDLQLAATTIALHEDGAWRRADGGDGPWPDDDVLRGLVERLRTGEGAHDGPAPHDTAVEPLHVDGVVDGVLYARCDEGGIQPETAQALQLLADHVSQALSLSRSIDADRRTLARLRDVDQQRSDFVATVSHELRTPLTIIDGLVETLHLHSERLSPAQQDQMLDRLRANSGSLRNVVTSLLDSARLDAGLVPDESCVELGDLVRRVVDQLAPLLEDHDVVVRTPDGVTARGDEDLLRLVLENLLTNAARHTPAGTRVEVAVAEVEDDLVVSVQDDGPGIDAELLPRITQRFVRGGDHRTRTTRGLGIGLALVEQVLVLHGSHLHVAPAPGGGARFAFRLPTAADVITLPDTARSRG